MGMFSMCPACGSDYCSNCECVREKLSAQIKTLQQQVAALSVPSSPPVDVSVLTTGRMVQALRDAETALLTVARDCDQAAKNCSDEGLLISAANWRAQAGDIRLALQLSEQLASVPPSPPEKKAPTCWHGHTERVVGCVSCVLVFDRPAVEASVPPSPAWQPIETAPKEPLTEVLGNFDGVRRVMWWSVLEGWMTACGATAPAQPSHWMPLPAAPPQEPPS